MSNERIAPTVQEHIAEIDKTLCALRESWLEAKTIDKPKWFNRINAALDTRLVFMALRSKAEIPQTS